MSSILEAVEHLFVCTNTKEGWPLNIYDPSTGGAIWSYRGTELQGEAPGEAVIVADQHVFATVKGRPVIAHYAVQSKNRSHFRSITQGPIDCLAVTKDGAICSGAIGEKIYTWMVCNGSMTSILAAHYQPITRMSFTRDGSFLISGGKDGRLLVWNTTDLLASPAVNTPNLGIAQTGSPSKCWSAHSLPITDLKVGLNGGGNCRVFSVSLDQSAKIHNLASGQLIMTLIFDCALTTCAVDDQESRLFVGTIKGTILQVNLFMQPVARERHVQTSVENTDYPVFHGHTQRITNLSVNLDCTLLASGSEDRSVRVWHIASRQCLKSISHSGSISTVNFIPILPAMMDGDDYVCTHPVQQFQKQLQQQQQQVADDTTRRGNVVVKLQKRLGSIILPDVDQIEQMLEQLRQEEVISRESGQEEADDSNNMVVVVENGGGGEEPVVMMVENRKSKRKIKTRPGGGKHGRRGRSPKPPTC